MLGAVSAVAGSSVPSMALSGFEYDVTGHCVATPYADPPKDARLRVFETREVLGLIFALWGSQGREPQMVAASRAVME